MDGFTPNLALWHKDSIFPPIHFHRGPSVIYLKSEAQLFWSPDQSLGARTQTQTTHIYLMLRVTRARTSD